VSGARGNVKMLPEWTAISAICLPDKGDVVTRSLLRLLRFFARGLDLRNENVAHVMPLRLHAMYGDDAQLIIDSGAAGFEVSFTVPRTNAEDADDE
jgi:hypothetical protein